jgi:transposase
VSEDLLTDQLWRRLAPLIPPRPRRFRYLGRRPVDDRTALAGIVFVLRTGVAGRDLPTTVGCFGVTCGRRLRDWQATGVWQAVHEKLLAELRAAGRRDLPAALVDAAYVHALTGGSRAARPRSTGPIPARNII